MKKPKEKSSNTHLKEAQSLTLGNYAYTVISEQYRNLVKQEKKVLADQDPEHLHHMRVSSRRLRTALQVFSAAIQLPKAASAQGIRALAKILGNLRDLDVQIADLQDHYRPQLTKAEQAPLDTAIAALHKKRRKAFAATEAALTRSRYEDLKTAYETWLHRPQYTELAYLPLQLLLPDLLSPLLAELLLHPGWLVPATHSSSAESKTLHDLRKACKHVRYQAEFFVSLYGNDFQNWIEEIKTIQSNLGRVQDSQVLMELLSAHLPKRTSLPTLQTAIQQTQAEALSDWETIRNKYLSPEFRVQLRQWVLEPNRSESVQEQPSQPSDTQPEKVSGSIQPHSQQPKQPEISHASS